MEEERIEELTELAIEEMDLRRSGIKANCRCEAIGAKLRKAAFVAIADKEGISDQTAKKRFSIGDNMTGFHFCCVQCCDCQYERIIEGFEINERDE
jgi:hypothetical protein